MKTEGGKGQEASKKLVMKGLLAEEEVGLYLRKHLASLRYCQIGSDEARFVFWNDCSGGQTFDQVRSDNNRGVGYCEGLTEDEGVD